MANKNPSIGTRFNSNNQPKNKGRKKGRTATDWLRTLSHTNIEFNNPLTGKTEIGEVNLVVAIQLILKATQDSDLPSIREYFDRLDGKVSQPLEHFGSGEINIFIKNIIQKSGLDDTERKTDQSYREIPIRLN